jgi:hypothetical protein
MSTTPESDPTIIKLENVRLSFPSLFTATTGPDGKGKPAFAATFILDKKQHAAVIAQLRKAIDQVALAEWKGKYPVAKLKGICLRDGDEKPDIDGYGDAVMFVAARSTKRVPVVDRSLGVLVEEDGKPYAGCYVNATIRLWAQDNEFGKRVNAALRAVQFVKDGEPFGEAPADAEKEFSNLEESDEGVI